MPTENSIIAQKSARYFTLSKLTSKTKRIWIVLHGYGQLAHEFICEFDSISNDENFIVAPEGLNRFYFRGFNGKIGASWMTKEDRENDIKDYVNFLNQVYTEITEQFLNNTVEINVLGFSQGCHTSLRWLDRTNIKVTNLFLFGGSFPDDIDFKSGLEFWNSINIKLFVGEKDRMVDKSKLENQILALKKNNLKPRVQYFEGGHQISQDILLELANK